MTVENEASRLLKALALSQRFHLYIAQCASPRAADQLIHAIETQLPKRRGAPVQVVRLDPYAEQASDAPLTTELLERVLVPLLAAPAKRRGHGTIHVVDASRATASDDETWARLFASWNEKRNLLQQLGGEVVVVVPRALSLVFATEAPDVWSIRSGEYEIAEQLAAPDVPAASIRLGDEIEVDLDGVSDEIEADLDDVKQAVPASKVMAAVDPSFDLLDVLGDHPVPDVVGPPVHHAVPASIDVLGDHPVPEVALPAPDVTREPQPPDALHPSAVGGAGSANEHNPPRISQALAKEDRAAGPAVAKGVGGRIAGPAAPAPPPAPAPLSVLEATHRPTFAMPSPWRLIPPLSLFGGDLVVAPWLRDVLHGHETRQLSQPAVGGAKDDARLHFHRQLRAVEVALGDRQFADLEDILAKLDDVSPPDGATELRLRVAQAVALAAQDRPREARWPAQRAQVIAEALAYPVRAFALTSALGAAAYVAWCTGQLASAVTLDHKLGAEAHEALTDAKLLQAMERGRMDEAGRLAAKFVHPTITTITGKLRVDRGDPAALAQCMIAADFAFLGDDLASARRDVQDAVARARSADPAPVASGSILIRARPFAALLAVAQGDLHGADRVLRGAASPPAAGEEPLDAAPRQAAFAAYAAGVVASERGDRDTARARLKEARQAIARWAAVGFDRRSLRRAYVATLLSACAVDDDPARAAAWAREAQAHSDALVGTRGEDHIARVLAVLARRARMRHTVDAAAAHALVHEAAEIAAPLRADGVARWVALADACAREAARGPG